jgi:hypothetical protein
MFYDGSVHMRRKVDGTKAHQGSPLRQPQDAREKEVELHRYRIESATRKAARILP